MRSALVLSVFFISALLWAGVIVDHTTTDYTQIPDYYVNLVKSTCKSHYAHTSHGSQLSSAWVLLWVLIRFMPINRVGAACLPSLIHSVFGMDRQALSETMYHRIYTLKPEAE